MRHVYMLAFPCILTRVGGVALLILSLISFVQAVTRDSFAQAYFKSSTRASVIYRCRYEITYQRGGNTQISSHVYIYIFFLIFYFIDYFEEDVVIIEVYY